MNNWKIRQFIGGYTYEEVDVKKLQDEAKALLMYLDREAKKYGWNINIRIVGAIYDGLSISKIPVRTGKPGRPKTEISILRPRALQVKPHLHFILKACPGQTVAQAIKKYWNKRHKDNIFIRKAWEQNKGFMRYMDYQSIFERKKLIGSIDVVGDIE